MTIGIDMRENGEKIIKGMVKSPAGKVVIRDGNEDLTSAFRIRRNAFIALLLRPSPETIGGFSDAINNLTSTVSGLSGMLPANYARMIPAQNQEFQDILQQHGFEIDINVILNFFSEERLDIPRIINFLQALPADNLHELELSTLTTPQKIIAYLQNKVANSDFAQFLQEIKDRKPEMYDQITKGKIAELLKENEKYFGAEKVSIREKATQWFKEKILREAA